MADTAMLHSFGMLVKLLLSCFFFFGCVFDAGSALCPQVESSGITRPAHVQRRGREVGGWGVNCNYIPGLRWHSRIRTETHS